MLAVEQHLVRPHRAGSEALDHDERIVMPFDAEGPVTAPQYLDLTGCVGLHPDSRTRGIDVPEHGAEDEGRHRRDVPRRSAVDATAVGRGVLPRRRLEGRRSSSWSVNAFPWVAGTGNRNTPPGSKRLYQFVARDRGLTFPHERAGVG